jgi:hypothetical protein
MNMGIVAMTLRSSFGRRRGGAAAVRFHRPDSGLGFFEKAASSVRAARKLESLVKLWDLKPANDLLRDRDDNEAYLAADAGRAYCGRAAPRIVNRRITWLR